jgi:two-component system phosphate regulon sensor histidine kinase PhoR
LDTIARTRDQAPSAAIVVLTGLEDEALALEALREGAQDYLVKGQMNGNLLVRSIRYAIERKRGEEQIRRLNEELEQRVQQRTTELQAIQSSMTEGLVAVNNKGEIVTFNEAAANITGLNAEQTVGKPAMEVLHAMAQVIENTDTVDAIADVLKGAVDLPTSIHVTIMAPQRRELVATAFPIPLGSPGQQMIGFLLRDATQERQLERRREAFVSVASHELRSPMTSLIGFVELLLQQKAPQATQQKWLELLYRESIRLASILDDMLNISRIQSGGLTANLEPVSLQDVVQSTLLTLRPTTNIHDFAVDISWDIANVNADRDKLSQVLLNLLDNAVKYSPRGGLITVAAHHQLERQRVVTLVSDQGMGISDKDQEDLFDTFHRVRRAETEDIKGTGLGLYIVKILLDLMQGEVWVGSELDKGATFSSSLHTTPV